MYGIVVDGEVKYVSCIEDFKDLLGTETYNTMVKLWEESERSARCELEQNSAYLGDVLERLFVFESKAEDYHAELMKTRKENELLREELLMLRRN